MQKNMTNILITRHDKIGDFVVSLPMFKVLKSQRKDVKTFALVSKVNFNFAKEIPFIDEVILYDLNNLDKTLKDIKAAKIDISISAFIDNTLGWLLFKARIKTRIAPATKIAQIFFNKTLKQKRSRVEKKEFEYNLDLLKVFDKTLNLKYECPLVKFDDKIKEEVLHKFKKTYNIKDEEKIIALHPGFGGSSGGNLTLIDYVKLAKNISKENNTKVVFTFGPDDIKTKEEIKSLIDFECILFESKGSIIDFSILLSTFDLFISTSTGPMHLAALSNARTISFFGSKKVATPNRWASINQKKNQNNFVISENYENELFGKIKKEVLKII